MTRRRRRLFLSLILVAGAAAYLPNLGHPFVFDEESRIVHNPRLRDPLAFFKGFGTEGYSEDASRLIPNLTLSLNHALSGLDPRGYAATNLLIHLLVVWLVVRFGRVVLDRLGVKNSAVPYLAAALFAVHPLNSEAVNYGNARANLIVTAFYLAALICLIRAVESGRWGLFGVLLAAALLSKELAVTIVVMGPLLLLALGKKFSPRMKGVFCAVLGLAIVAGISTGAFREVGRVYGQAGHGVSFFVLNALGQCRVLAAYFGLALLPLPWFLNAEHDVRASFPVSLACAVLLAGMMGGAILLRRRAPFVSLFLAWPFIAHAPTSLVPRVEQMVEYRTYLPMVGVCLLLGWGLSRWKVRWVVGLMLALTAGTVVRNRVWRSPVAFWSDVVAKSPLRARAHNNLGAAWLERGRFSEAEACFAEALRLDPREVSHATNLASALGAQGKIDEARVRLEEALRMDPENAQAHLNLGTALWKGGRNPEALSHFRDAARLRPDLPEAHNNLAALLLQTGRPEEAVGHFQEALRLRPGYPEAQLGLTAALKARERKR